MPVSSSKHHSTRLAQTIARAMVLTIAATALLMAPAVARAETVITDVSGSASGYFLSVSLFGGPANTRGPAPTVTIAADASNSPLSANAPAGSAAVGPATFFSWQALQVSAQASLGPAGSVTTSAHVTNANTTASESFTASSVDSTCTSSTSSTTGSTSVTNGTLEIDNGNDINGDGDFVDPGEHPPVVVLVPTNPAANTSFNGHIHVNGAVDNFQYIFNEQVVSAGGELTVNAGHERILGPTAVGDLWIAMASCRATGAAAPDTTAPPVPTITSGPAGLTRSTDATFGFTTTGDAVATRCGLDGAPFAPCTSPTAYAALANGLHTFRVLAVDAAGNRSAAASYGWRIDRIRPTVTSKTPAPGASTADRTPLVGATVRDDVTNLAKSQLRLFRDGVAVAGASWSYDRATDRLRYQAPGLARGTHTIRITARDAAGNLRATTWQFTIQ